MRIERTDKDCITIEIDGKRINLSPHDAEALADRLQQELQAPYLQTESEVLADIAKMEYKAEKAI